jgi:transposase
MESFTIFAGVDWGSQTHQLCALDGTRNVLLEKAVAHSGVGLAELAASLLALTRGDPSRIAVAIEVPRGPVVETLLEQGIAVFAINPKQLDRFRDRHTVSGAKDDRRDALVLADSLRTDAPAFRRLQMASPLLLQLRDASRMHDELKAERVALGNRLREQLQRYFPQILQLDTVHDAVWLWDLLEIAPEPVLARRLTTARLGSLLRRHRIRRLTAQRVREQLCTEALRVAPGVTDACRRHVLMLVRRLRLVDAQKADVEREIEAMLDELAATERDGAAPADVSLLRSMPGLGKLVCATLLAEAPEALEKRDYASLRTLCGVAPVTKRSGKQHAVLIRTGCNHRLRNAVHYWTANAVQRDEHFKSQYARLRGAGHSHARALRGIGDRLLAQMIAILRTRTPFDPNRRRDVPRRDAPVTVHIELLP